MWRGEYMNDYNFFTASHNKRRLQFNAHSPYFLAFVVILIFGTVAGWLYIDNILTARQIDLLNSQITNIKSSEDYIAANKLQKSIDAMTKYDTSANLVLKDLNNAKVLDSELISSLLGGVPTNVTIVSFGMNGNSFGMTCNAPNRKIAAELLLGLKETGLRDDIVLNSVTSKDTGGVVVSIDGTLKEGMK